MNKGAAWMCTTLLGLAAAQAVAGSFSVAPTRVEFEGTRRTAVISLRNTDTVPLTVQASVVDWKQPTGEDVYAATRDILATPPVFTIPPNGEQIVRIALRRAVDPAREIPYRIFFQELPQPLKPTTNTLNVALRVGVPIFVRPPKADDSVNLQWQAHRVADGKLQVDATNTGTTHVQVTDFDVVFGGATEPTRVSVVKYILPGSRVSWTVAPPASAASAAQIRIQGYSDHGDFQADATVAPAP